MADANQPPLEEAGELMQVLFDVAEHCTPGTEAEVVHAIAEKEGVRTIDRSDGKLKVIYDPLRVTEKELEAAIRAAGHQVEEIETRRDSPFA
jgi:hypothetical protein